MTQPTETSPASTDSSPPDAVSLREIWRGDLSKPDPFTIAIVANPFLEAPLGSGVFVQDPIIGNEPAFDAAADYSAACLEGSVPGMAEALFGPSDIRTRVRLVALFVENLPPHDANALVALRPDGFILEPRRRWYAPFLARLGVEADVAFAVSKAERHNRASAWFTSDDDARAGTPFDLNGVQLHHRHYARIPGTIAIHSDERSLTPLHEFQHALSSYENGGITDLYVNSHPDVNNRWRRRASDPVPADFGRYDGTSYASDPNRDGLGYPQSWRSFHCELHDATRPAVMDNYFRTADPMACRNDRITRSFLEDRLRAKINR